MPSIEPPEPKAQQLLGVLVEALRSGNVRENQPETFPTYSMVLQWLGRPSPSFYPGSRLRKLGLDRLNEWTIRNEELPKVTALIVNKSTHRPGKGFAESHGFYFDDPQWPTWWLEQANRAIRYDWTPFLPATPRGGYGKTEPISLRVREDGDEQGFGSVIVADPPPARIRTTGTTVSEVLQWLAAGESESEILLHHPGLRREDIRASLAFAAEREQRAAMAEAEPSRLSTLARQWQGKLTLPKGDPGDPRMDHLLRKYWRNRA